MYIFFFLLMLPFWRLATGCILFLGCPCVRPSVRDHILKICEHDMLQTACGNFTKFALGDKDELVRFWGKMVKGQFRDPTKYGEKSLDRRHRPTGRRFVVEDHVRIAVIGKSKIRSHSQISNPIFPWVSNLIVTILQNNRIAKFSNQIAKSNSSVLNQIFAPENESWKWFKSRRHFAALSPHFFTLFTQRPRPSGLRTQY